jgi:hypothetical protein
MRLAMARESENFAFKDLPDFLKWHTADSRVYQTPEGQMWMELTLRTVHRMIDEGDLPA